MTDIIYVTMSDVPKDKTVKSKTVGKLRKELGISKEEVVKVNNKNARDDKKIVDGDSVFVMVNSKGA